MLYIVIIGILSIWVYRKWKEEKKIEVVIEKVEEPVIPIKKPRKPRKKKEVKETNMFRANDDVYIWGVDNTIMALGNGSPFCAITDFYKDNKRRLLEDGVVTKILDEKYLMIKVITYPKPVKFHKKDVEFRLTSEKPGNNPSRT